MASSKRDPAFRPYRLAVYVVFIAIVSFGAALAVTSIVRSLARAAPASTPVGTPGQPLSEADLRTCLDRLQSLHAELDERFASLPELAAAEGPAGLRTWQRFSRSFTERLGQVSSDCGLADADQGRRPLAALLDHLEALHRVYASHGTRLLREDGAVVRRAEAAFRESADAAEEDPTPAP